ncbi:MAG: response regulator [Lachnospiraceae bacterium]|nr:response regulator [Lachnospiraceae bacterium]
MYSIIIVDDEKFEREGMERLIPWEKYGVQLAGSAADGKSAYEIICELKPDIVLTDIQMPEMNGIELLNKTKESFPEIEFIILSGYGDFEYTSSAMAQGVRHYVLKPCDEKRIGEVLKKVTEELDKRKTEKEEALRIRKEIRELTPKAKQQMFRNILLEREITNEDYERLSGEIGIITEKIRILSFRKNEPFDELEEFATGNVLNELLEKDPDREGVLASVTIGNDLVFLLKDYETKEVENAVYTLADNKEKFLIKSMKASLSPRGEAEDIRKLYLKSLEQFNMGDVDERAVFFGDDRAESALSEGLFDYAAIKECKEYEDYAFNIFLILQKLKLNKKKDKDKLLALEHIARFITGEEVILPNEVKEDRKLFEETMVLISAHKDREGISKEEERDRLLLRLMYENMEDTELSIKYIASAIMYMNEEYLGRCFQKRFGKKFTAYLQETRIYAAEKLMTFRPEARLSEIAPLVKQYKPPSRAWET